MMKHYLVSYYAGNNFINSRGDDRIKIFHSLKEAKEFISALNTSTTLIRGIPDIEYRNIRLFELAKEIPIKIEEEVEETVIKNVKSRKYIVEE